jgi:hypothetical protein
LLFEKNLLIDKCRPEDECFGTGGGKSRNLIHKPQNQIREFRPLDRLPPLLLPLPDTTIDHRTNGEVSNS